VASRGTYDHAPCAVPCAIAQYSAICVVKYPFPLKSAARESPVISKVTPGELTNVFAPISKTLEELCLLRLCFDVPYDGSQMDLSGFRKLSDLEISSCCLLFPGPPCEDSYQELFYLTAPARQLLRHSQKPTSSLSKTTKHAPQHPTERTPNKSHPDSFFPAHSGCRNY
jgi:hypothetical protein